MLYVSICLRHLLKILFISHDASLTGAPRELLLIVKHLDKQMFHPVVILGADGPLRSEFEKHAETVISPLFPGRAKYVREFSLARRRLSLLKELKPDLVYCNTVRSAKWLLYARMCGISTVLHVHELADVFDALSFADRLLIRRCARRYVAASNRVREFLVRSVGIPARMIEVFHESIEVRQFTRERSEALSKSLFPSGADLIIGTVGRVSAFKGTDVFLEMAMHVSAMRGTGSSALAGPRAQKIKFLIVGEASETDGAFVEMLRRRLKECALDQDVIITGAQQDVRPHFSLIDICVLASPDDPFPLVNLEAMALSLPVVAFDAGGNREALDDCGVLVKEMSSRALAREVVRLIADDDERTRLGSAGRSRALALFDIEKNIGALERLLQTRV